MKKTLVVVLTLVFVFAFTSTSLAANTSFTDVPSNHWAYGAVSQLAKAGLVDGFEDGTFRGDKTISRYEFAIITAKALDRYDRADAANKALIDKLSAEFASELNTLGVRVAKVEAKTKVWVGGETRFRWGTDSPGPETGTKLHGSDSFDFRQRIKFLGTIDDKTSWEGRLSVNGSNKFGNTDAVYGSNVYLDIMNVKLKDVLGLDNVRIGRSSFDMFGYGLFAKPFNMDGIRIDQNVGNKVTFTGWTGNIKADTNLGTGTGDSGNANQVTTGQLTYKLDDSLTMKIGYYWSDVPGAGYTAAGNSWSKATMNTYSGSFSGSRGWDAAVMKKMGIFTLTGEYVGTHLGDAVGVPSDPKGWIVELSTRKANTQYYPILPIVDPMKKGTSAWVVSYRSADAGVIPANIQGLQSSMVGYSGNPYSVVSRTDDNVNAFLLGYESVLRKGVVLSLDYQDYKIKNQSLTDLPSKNLDKFYQMRLEFFY